MNSNLYFGYFKQEDWVLCRVFYKSRGLSSKPSMDTNHDQDRSFSSLPPLMETYITFGQTPVSLQEGYEQVPCFSNPFHSSTAAMVGPLPAAPAIMPFKNINAAHVGGLPDLVGSGLNQLDCDKKVIRAVLNHLTKLEGNQKRGPPPGIGEGSIDSYLSENGLSNSVW